MKLPAESLSAVVAPVTDKATSSLLSRYQLIRQATEQLCASLSAEDCAVQSMPDASPVKWHLAHTSWFFETFILAPCLAGYAHFNPAFRVLFNSYYQTVGEQYARPQRGLLTRPSLDETLCYREHVDRAIQKLFTSRDQRELPVEVIELGLSHEQQHQELILTDLKHLFSFNPLNPVYCESVSATDETPPLGWFDYDAGVQWIGHEGVGFSFDNEGPRHRVFLESFALASRLVTNGEYLEFIEDGGYERPEFWLSDGWNAVQQSGWRAPLYWQRRDNEWLSYTLAGLRKLNLNEPVCHVSFYEADAFARRAGARLPTEMEWEFAASSLPLKGNFVESRLLHPTIAADNAAAPAQMFGDVWEWTQSSYSPYPGYQAPAGALGEYNGKFMCNQIVLRGGSCVTPESHLRATYRNYFPPPARWQFNGIRLARDGR
jgi:ergothioneine biosynthesis protein EgtB